MGHLKPASLSRSVVSLCIQVVVVVAVVVILKMSARRSRRPLCPDLA